MPEESTDPVPHNVVILRDEEETPREQQEVAEPQVQEHESEGQYETPNLNNPNASGSHKQQELAQPTPVITRSGRVYRPPNRL